MRLLFIFTTCITITGALTDSQRVEVKEGENVTLDTKTPETESVDRVGLLKYANGTKRPIFRYCSPKEEKAGCDAVHPERISLQNGSVLVTLPDVRATDAGQYVVEVIGDNLTSKTSFTLVFPGQLLSTPSPESDPPSWEPAESYSTKGTERLDIDGMPWVVAVGVAVGVAVVIAVVVVVVVAVVVAVGVAVGIAVGIAVGVAELISIYYRSKKSEAGDDAGDSEENNSCRESISGAGEDATGESFRMEDRIPCSTDEDRLTGVQIQDTSMGQESGRPGQHELLNDYKDSDYKYNRKNNKNDYEDSNYYSSDDSENITNSSDIISIY